MPEKGGKTGLFEYKVQIANLPTGSRVAPLLIPASQDVKGVAAILCVAGHQRHFGFGQISHGLGVRVSRIGS